MKTTRTHVLLAVSFIAGLFAISSPVAAETLNFGPPYLLKGNFKHPFGLATSSGTLFVADTGNRRFKWMTIALATGSYSFTSAGFVSNVNSPDALVEPQGIAVDASKNVFVVNTLQGHVKLYRPSGPTFTLDPTFASASSHTVSNLPITLPRDIAAGADGAIYLLDSGNNRILKATNSNATSWTVFHQGSGWKNPYGLSVASNGDVFVADTGNHRIVKISGGSTTVFGGWGTQAGRFRFPRDVAVDQHGRIFVADTYNHRITVLSSDGGFLRNLGYPPAVRSLVKIVVDHNDHLFALDSDGNHVLAFLGAGVPPPFDVYFRDHIGDPGDEPSNPNYERSSPDILVRHQPDINLASAAVLGLEYWPWQEPRYGQNNYVYVALHNRGTQPASDNFAKLFWFDYAVGNGSYPDNWNESGVYESYYDPTHNQPGNTLHFPIVQPGGVMVLGPLVFRPPHPDVSQTGGGEFQFGLRVNNPFDPAPTVGNSPNFPKNFNNVTRRRFIVNEGPFTTGQQNTLVIRAHFPDIAGTTSASDVRSKVEKMAAWVSSVSWNQASVTLLERGPITLPEPSSYYYSDENNPLVEMVTSALDTLLGVEPQLLDGQGEGSQVGRIVIVTNDGSTERDWATTGHWPYVIKGVERNLSASIQGKSNPPEMFYHGMSHQLNMVDLYPHENHHFPKPYADKWDNMAKPFNGVHPLLWSKEKAEWPSYAQAKILFVPRPDPGVTWNNNGNKVKIKYQVRASSGDTVGIAFGLTHGITSFNEETAFYYVEARAPNAPKAGPDAAVPDTGVIMYYANRLIPQGQGPVILRDHVPGGTLDDAAIPVGGTNSPGGTGISVKVLNGTGGADYNLDIEYTPPATDYDVYMNQGDPNFLSPDIWVDNQQNGYDENNGDSAADRGDLAIAGEENRVYAKVSNHGPADAYDVEVAFFFSEPWHTVGEETEFDEFRAVFIDQLPGEESKTAFVEWTPETGVEPHTCARVELRRLFSDTNSANDWAQKNLQVDHSVHGSPYTPVKFKFSVSNDRPTRRPVYFQLKGVPAGWTTSFNPKKLVLNPGERGTAEVTFLPPPNAPDCTSHVIYVTGWIPDGDTMMRTGGAVVNVNLSQKTQVTANLSLQECDKEKDRKAGRGRCMRIVIKGCTTPPLPNQEITVKYEGPDGEPIYHKVMTDENGCYEDFLVTVEGGEWQAGVETPAADCKGPSRKFGTITVPLPEKNRPESDLPKDDHRLMVTAFSKNLSGRTQAAKVEKRPTDCNSIALRQVVDAKVVASGNESGLAAQMNGDLTFLDLLHFVMPSQKGAGTHRGRFRWITPAGVILGRVEGLTDLGTHRPPASQTGTECAPILGHWETSLVGTFVTGPNRGSRVRANGLISINANPNAPYRPAEFKGTLEGVVEKDCTLTPAQTLKRIQRAISDSRMAEDPCGKIPCLTRLGLSGVGQMKLMQKGQDRCDKRKPSSIRTWNKLSVPLTTDKCAIPAAAVAVKKMSGVFHAPMLSEVFDPAVPSRAVHGGSFTFVSTDGLIIQGTMLGITASGTHRKPALNIDLEKAFEDRHLEGRLTGTIMSGPQAGKMVSTRYVIKVDKPIKPTDRKRKVHMVIDGWIINGCLVLVSPEQPVISATTTIRQPVTTAVQKGRVRLNKTQMAKLQKKQEKKFRPLSEINPASVAAYKAANGGKLTRANERELQVADREFRRVDLDRVVGLSSSEFSLVWSLPKKPASARAVETPAARMVKKWDKNKNGGIEKKENPSMWSRNASLDTNKDGKISAAELAVLHRKNETDAFATADKNKDGRVDFTEFVLWQRSWPRVGSK